MNNINFRYSEKYCDIFYFFATWYNRLTLYLYYKDIMFLLKYRNVIYYILRYGFDFVLLNILCYELIFNNMVLVIFLKVLPYYSFYKLIYRLNYYISKNMDYLSDVPITYILYNNYPELEVILYEETDQFKELCEGQPVIDLRNYIKKNLL